MTIKEIKKLAKETLKKKWYPLKKGVFDIDANDPCVFCNDASSRRETFSEKSCEVCYIGKYKNILCNLIYLGMEEKPKEFDNIIEKLEILAKRGKL